LFGENDQNLKRLRTRLEAKILARGDSIRIEGEASQVKIAEGLIRDLLAVVRQGGSVTLEEVDRGAKVSSDGGSYLEDISTHIPGESVLELPKRLKPKTKGQKLYIDAIMSNEITFGIGPAGTGKSYLAVAMAVAHFKAKRVKRIILTRPAVEAGERLGFLPGDLQAKIDPYLRPLYDALLDMIEPERFESYITSGAIEVAPLAFMRGRTLSDAFVILDEAQNTTPEQMKMFLTRMGFSSKVVVTGDITQVDLPKNITSGLEQARRLLTGIPGIGFVKFDETDVVRHPLVAEIVKAYDQYDESKLNAGSSRGNQPRAVANTTPPPVMDTRLTGNVEPKAEETSLVSSGSEIE
jgi:phosphate starvation-inducible protein PhoH and related proteins